MVATMPGDLHYGVSEHEKASRHRLDDARALLTASRWRGAMYLAGYSVECLLKAKLMRMFGCRHLVELEDELQRRGALSTRTTILTHQLHLLLRLTQCVDRLRRDQKTWRAFLRVNTWVPAWRYTASIGNRDDAKDFLESVDKLRFWIEHNT